MNTELLHSINYFKNIRQLGSDLQNDDRLVDTVEAFGKRDVDPQVLVGTRGR